MQIDPAAAVAGALPFPSRREGAGKWRTRGLCHGSGEKPDSASLIFHDPEDEGGPLAVWCYKCQPRTAAERDRIRHALQAATGLTLCRCDDCWQAWHCPNLPCLILACFVPDSGLQPVAVAGSLALPDLCPFYTYSLRSCLKRVNWVLGDVP